MRIKHLDALYTQAFSIDNQRKEQTMNDSKSTNLKKKVYVHCEQLRKLMLAAKTVEIHCKEVEHYEAVLSGGWITMDAVFKGGSRVQVLSVENSPMNIVCVQVLAFIESARLKCRTECGSENLYSDADSVLNEYIDNGLLPREF